MLYVCVRGVMDVVFSVCVVMQMLYVCVVCASCSSSQCCILHDLQFVNAGRGCKMRQYVRGILQSRSIDSLKVVIRVSLCYPILLDVGLVVYISWLNPCLCV